MNLRKLLNAEMAKEEGRLKNAQATKSVEGAENAKKRISNINKGLDNLFMYGER